MSGRRSSKILGTASVALWQAPAYHPSLDCSPCCGASPFTSRPVTKEWQLISAIMILVRPKRIKQGAASAGNGAVNQWTADLLGRGGAERADRGGIVEVDVVVHKAR